jgi:flagellar protein FliO/FliZ
MAMYANIIGTQQILITAAFLGVMILLLIILRKKSTVIRASMKAGKRINVVEDAAVSPTERLRLVIIDSKEFVMVSAKGHAPSLIPLSIANAGSTLRKKHQHDEAGDSEAMRAAVADAMHAHAVSKPFEGSSSAKPINQASEMTSTGEQQAFAQTFQSWRQQNAAR